MEEGMWSGTWNGMSWYRSGPIKAVARELAKYKLDLVGVQGIRWDNYFFIEKETKINEEQDVFVHHRIEPAG
jgi:hypothetical protein